MSSVPTLLPHPSTDQVVYDPVAVCPHSAAVCNRDVLAAKLSLRGKQRDLDRMLIKRLTSTYGKNIWPPKFSSHF